MMDFDNFDNKKKKKKYAQDDHDSQFSSEKNEKENYITMDPKKYLLKSENTSTVDNTADEQFFESENIPNEQKDIENKDLKSENIDFFSRNKQAIIGLGVGILIGAVGLFAFGSDKLENNSSDNKHLASVKNDNVLSEPIKENIDQSKQELGEFELTVLGDKAFMANDYYKAVGYYKRAADRGYAEAQNKYGDCLINGTGVEKNKREAVYWYEKSANGGSAEGMNNLGFCYEMGYGVSKNYDLAVQWYKKAVDLGLMNAQYNLADCYEKGNGVPKDLSKAKQLYTLAYSQGHSESGNCLRRLNGIGENGYVRAGYITGDDVIMRSRPSTLGNEIDVLYKNNYVDIINVVECKDSTAAILENQYRLRHRGEEYILNEKLGLKIIRDMGDKYECGFVINDEAIQAEFYKSDVRKLYGDRWYCVRHNGKLGYIYGKFVSVR